MPVWKAVVRSTPKVSPASIYNASNHPKVSNFDVRYDKGVKTLTFYGEIRSARRSVGYTLIVTFKRVEPKDGLSLSEIKKGFKPKPTLGKHEVMLRCSCLSYRFRFDKANRDHGVGTGARFGVYRRKTNRKGNNEKNLIGGCKHCFEFVTYLKNNGFVY